MNTKPDDQTGGDLRLLQTMICVDRPGSWRLPPPGRHCQPVRRTLRSAYR
ncbi:MAG: hypothetical protein WCQ21_37675 [Verrucomicrobiota bacterium]